ncbi:MAG: hypothetical protein ABSD42_01630 [Candidatus Bathyarchaeia archaeon]
MNVYKVICTKTMQTKNIAGNWQMVVYPQINAISLITDYTLSYSSLFYHLTPS